MLYQAAQLPVSVFVFRDRFRQEVLDQPVAVVAKPNRADTVSPVITPGRFGRRLNFMGLIFVPLLLLWERDHDLLRWRTVFKTHFLSAPSSRRQMMVADERINFILRLNATCSPPGSAGDFLQQPSPLIRCLGSDK